MLTHTHTYLDGQIRHAIADCEGKVTPVIERLIADLVDAVYDTIPWEVCDR